MDDTFTTRRDGAVHFPMNNWSEKEEREWVMCTKLVLVHNNTLGENKTEAFVIDRDRGFKVLRETLTKRFLRQQNSLKF